MGKKILVGAAIIAVLSFVLAVVAPGIYNDVVNAISDFFAWIATKAQN